MATPSPQVRPAADDDERLADGSSVTCNRFLYVTDVSYVAMVSMTLSIPDEMKAEMDEHPEINWSEVARQSIDRKLAELEILEEFKRESELTEDEAVELGRRLNDRLAKRYQE